MNALTTRPFVVALEHERVRLVVPRDAVVVEDLCALDLDPVREPRRVVSTICLENGAFVPHLRQGTNGLGRPRDAAVDFDRVPDRADLRPALRRDVLRGEPARARDRRDQRAPARRRRLLRRPDDVRVPARVPDRARVHRPHRLRLARRRSRQPRLPQRRLRPLRGDVRRAELGAPQRAGRRSSPSTRASPTSTTARSAAAATAGSRSSSRPSRRS